MCVRIVFVQGVQCFSVCVVFQCVCSVTAAQHWRRLTFQAAALTPRAICTPTSPIIFVSIGIVFVNIIFVTFPSFLMMLMLTKTMPMLTKMMGEVTKMMPMLTKTMEEHQHQQSLLTNHLCQVCIAQFKC